MKLSEFIKKLQEYQKEINGNAHSYDKIDFVLINDKNYSQENYYTEVDFEILENSPVGYCIDYLPCGCMSGLTLVFRKEEIENETTRD